MAESLGSLPDQQVVRLDSMGSIPSRVRLWQYPWILKQTLNLAFLALAFSFVTGVTVMKKVEDDQWGGGDDIEKAAYQWTK